MVLGSCYYVETENHKFIVDCGMFQGPSIEHLNYEKFHFDPKDVEFVVLTHTHIDHSGLLPKLARYGFKGKLYCTTTTARLVELLLMDSAKIQESNLKNYKRDQKAEAPAKPVEMDENGQPIPQALDMHPGTHDPDLAEEAEYVYGTPDAMSILSNIQTFDYGETLELDDTLKFKFVDAGHILGAASLQMTAVENGVSKKVLWSGDIGHKGQGLISFFAPADGFRPDAIVMEATYGGKFHDNRTDTVNKLVEIIRDTTATGNNVIIPTFAAQRTQEILFELKKAKMFGKLPYGLEVYVDSPLAARITDVYQKSWRYLNAETRMFFENEDNAFNFPKLYFTRNAKDSQFLNKKRGVVILSGSGMCTGGRVLYHLSVNLPNPNAAVILVGFQAEETLGRELAEGAKEVEINNNKIPVRATINRLFGFSGHADQNGLMEYFKQYHFENTKNVFVVHSEQERAEALMKSIQELDPNINVTYPNLQQEFEI